MKKFILTVIVMSAAITIYSQDFVDNALLFSRTRPGGSARIQALGGAQTSLGGDYSSAFANPAGLGMYNRSEFTISPQLTFANSTSTFFGEKSDDTRAVFNLPGLSLAFHSPKEAETGFLGGTFAITLNRINDFNQEFRYEGTNNQSSLVHYFLEDANGVYFDNEILDPADLAFGENNFYSLTALAFNNYLIDTLRTENGELYYDSPLSVFWDEDDETGSVRQLETSKRKGAQYQWSFAYGANFSDKFFLGATLGVTTLRFRLTQTFNESNFVFNSQPDFLPSNFNYTVQEDYNIRGTGINFGIGAIYRPADFIQLGASIITPTFYQITDHYEASIRTQWGGFDYYGDGSDILDDVNEKFDQPLISEYNLSTPMRISTGATFISKIGFVTADVEFINYGKAKYTSDISEGFDAENTSIKADYQKVMNYRLGGEYRFQDYRVRAGFNYMSNPLITSGSNDLDQIGFSGGFGYRKENFFIDFAAMHSRTDGQRTPYFVGGPDPVVTQKFRYTNYMVTVGFTF